MKPQDVKASNKKLLFVLPLLTLPFITLAFWALGGGKGNEAVHTGEEKGLNIRLPDAHNAAGPMDKMSYYDQATADSLKKKQQSQNDPYYHQQGDPGATAVTKPMSQGQPINPADPLAYQDPNEARVYQKLGQLNRILQQQQPPEHQYRNYSPAAPTTAQPEAHSADIDRLERMMQNIQQGNADSDPETAQLNSMLERILDIQHPERVTEKLKAAEKERKGQVYAVTPAGKEDQISVMDNTKVRAGQDNSANGFFGLDDTAAAGSVQNAIEAAVHEDQTLVNGSTVKLRLLDDINVHGTIVGKDNFIYGTVSLEGERLQVKIKSLRYKKSLFPVQLSVFDIDGLDGIYIPGAIARDVAKSSADRSIQTFGLSTFDQSLGAQAAGAGIEAAKSFLSKKIKLIKVMVKAGYKVLLRDDRQKDEQ